MNRISEEQLDRIIGQSLHCRITLDYSLTPHNLYQDSINRLANRGEELGIEMLEGNTAPGEFFHYVADQIA